MQTNITWREILIRFSLIFICLGLWRSELNIYTFSMLGLAWLLDGGYYRCGQLIKEPLVQAILVLCVVLFLGFLWSDYPAGGRIKWKRYFYLLNFISFFSLLNNERLPWALGATLLGYCCVLFMGIYHWVFMQGVGVPFLKMSYLHFSAMLGIGAVLSFYWAQICRIKNMRILFFALMLLLLFMQFNQNGRGFLLATLITLSLVILLLHWAEIKKLIIVFVSLITITFVFAFSSDNFQDRLFQVKKDIALLQQGNYTTSVGYRIAMWDVGLDGIAKKPLLGHGTGMPVSYFEETVKTYKGGVYKDLPKFTRTGHFHNEWIEIGMHIGTLGILALAFLFWSWYQTFRVHHLRILGIALVSYIFLAGLTDTFILYSRTPVLLLIVTALAICWRKENYQCGCRTSCGYFARLD